MGTMKRESTPTINNLTFIIIVACQIKDYLWSATKYKITNLLWICKFPI